MARQLKLEPSDAAAGKPLHSTLIVLREQIPNDLPDADKRVLRANLDNSSGSLEFFFFRDCPEVRRVLHMGGSQ